LLFLSVLVWLLPPVFVWDGETPVRLKVTIIDQDSERPIPNATNRVAVPWNYRDMTPDETDVALRRILYLKATDAVGVSEFVLFVGAGGTKDILGKHGGFRLDHEISVTACGHRPVSVPLSTLLGKRRWRIRHSTFEVTLSLIKDLMFHAARKDPSKLNSRLP
jgi:hypothetical protein